MLPLNPTRLTRSDYQIRWSLLGLSLAPVLGACLHPWGIEIPLLSCPIRYLTGIPCPTCGMTRSFLAIARGDWQQAITEHLFGPILFLMFSVAAIHISSELITGQKIKRFYHYALKPQSFLTGLVIYLGYYLCRIYGLSQTQDLALLFRSSPLGKLLS